MLKQFHVLDNDLILKSPIISAAQKKMSLHAASIVALAEKRRLELIAQAESECETIRTQAYFEGFQTGLEASAQIASNVLADLNQLEQDVAKSALKVVNLSIDEWFISPTIMHALLAQLVQKKMIDKRYTVIFRLPESLKNDYSDWVKLFHSNGIETKSEMISDDAPFELAWGPHVWQIDASQIKKAIEDQAKYGFHPKSFRQQAKHIFRKVIKKWEEKYLPNNFKT